MSAAYFFYGDDDYTLSLTVKQWSQRFVVKHSAAAIYRLDSATDPDQLEQELQQAASAQSLFADLSLIILANPLSLNSDKLSDLLVKLIESADLQSHVVILWQRETMDKRRKLYKQLQQLIKSGKLTAKEYREPKGQELSQWIKRYFNQRGSTITEPSIDLILQRSVGLPLGLIAQRCELLSTVAPEIDESIVGQYIPPQTIADTFGITDAIAARNVSVALKRAIPLLLARSPKIDELAPSLGAINWLFRTLLQLKENSGQTEVNPYVQRKLAPFLGRWNLIELKQALIKAAEYDWQIKHGQAEYQWAIEDLILNCQSA